MLNKYVGVQPCPTRYARRLVMVLEVFSVV